MCCSRDVCLLCVVSVPVCRGSDVLLDVPFCVQGYAHKVLQWLVLFNEKLIYPKKNFKCRLSGGGRAKEKSKARNA